VLFPQEKFFRQISPPGGNPLIILEGENGPRKGVYPGRAMVKEHRAVPKEKVPLDPICGFGWVHQGIYFLSPAVFSPHFALLWVGFFFP